MGIVGFHIRVRFGHLVKDPLPEVVGIFKDIGFSAKGQFFIFIPSSRQLKGISDAPFDPFVGID